MRYQLTRSSFLNELFDMYLNIQGNNLELAAERFSIIFYSGICYDKSCKRKFKENKYKKEFDVLYYFFLAIDSKKISYIQDIVRKINEVDTKDFFLKEHQNILLKKLCGQILNLQKMQVKNIYSNINDKREKYMTQKEKNKENLSFKCQSEKIIYTNDITYREYDSKVHDEGPTIFSLPNITEHSTEKKFIKYLDHKSQNSSCLPLMSSSPNIQKVGETINGIDNDLN